jgi:hypothetical protein
MTQARGVKGVQNRAVFKFRAQDVPDQVCDWARLQVRIRRLGRQGNLNTEGGPARSARTSTRTGPMIPEHSEQVSVCS